MHKSCVDPFSTRNISFLLIPINLLCFYLTGSGGIRCLGPTWPPFFDAGSKINCRRRISPRFTPDQNTGSMTCFDLSCARRL